MRGKKTGGRNFKKGNKGGPGRPPVPEDIREIRKLTRAEFERLANKLLYARKDEIAKASVDPNTPAIELMIASCIHKAVIEGDERRLDFLLNRLVGKVKDQVEHSTKGDAPLVILTMPRNGREAEVGSPQPKSKKVEAGNGGT